jgi:hypothetical protein
MAQNWRLGHSLDKVGDFIEAFTEVVSSDELGCVQRTGIA